MTSVQDLAGSWELHGDGVDLPATVPGCVHTDLLAAGRIPDPFQDDNEHAVAWVGRADWTYRREVAWTGPAHERIDLVFEGLDTVATVELGGTTLGSSRNMHRSFRYDVTDLLDGDPRPLAVRFESAYTEAERVRELLGARDNAYPEPFNFIRKMACSFGWDWGPTLVTAGIWRPVRLEGWSTARLAEVRPLATYADGLGRLDLTVGVERTRDRDLHARVLLDGYEIAVLEIRDGETVAQAIVDAGAVTPWNPRGHGEPALYELSVELLDGDTVLDRWQRRTGFRTVAIDQTGGGFVFHLNGAPILVKGVNWIPDDIFPSRMTRARYELRLREAADAGVNLIRVWGGGLYESRDFYEVCDELGLMVWQDFLFACADYPEEEPLFSEVVAEARENVARLAPHPSLITWNGNNENLWLHLAMPWNADGKYETWGSRYYLETLPEIVAELDPTRPYQAGSPWSGSWDHAPNDTEHGTFHSWEVWNREDYLNYRNSTPRFVAEFGWQAPPAWTTLRDAVSDEPMLPDSPGVLHHQKAEDGNGKLARGLAPHFGDPASLSVEAWHYLTQLNQVRAIRTGVEHWQSHWPHTGGSILWQLNDLWPVTSWAAIDGAGRHKPLYHALHELYAPRALTIQPRDRALVVAVLNDHPAAWTGTVLIERQDTGGAVLASTVQHVSVAARSVTLIPVPADLVGEVLVARLDDARALWFPTEYSSDDPALTIDVESVPGGLDVHVRAVGLARDLLLQPDRIHPQATVDRGFVTLLAGESTVFHVRAPIELDPTLVKTPWVLTDLSSVLNRGKN
ncbi:beta-mannosidase [Actinoplanes sp. SE50]|uniref:glycoside hydrolase family 2 protein n=1 Tax=unclassified Actinoplanes TaxID=2626549 RepID=UPI00023EC98E|nr:MULTISPECIES: glycoside hydrolase family 2 protein [unclassified Actinoplanes]AEV84768.1 beta-mannosidase [Actinoplanes sp. SE50/110]ATO83160.1 beta-mannosidase [Actinoplanes sp. SE50]SLM00567.1 beta-mannosidase [Actinoplanes sp. SE50/110]